MRFQGFLQYERICLLTYGGMTILLSQEWPSDSGYTSRGYISYLISSVGIQKNLNLSQHNKSAIRMMKGNIFHLRTNQVKQISGLITYMRYIFESYNPGPDLCDDPFHPFSPDELAQHTPIQMRTYLIHHLPNPLGPTPIDSGPISSTRLTGCSTAAIECIGFKKGIKREIFAYPSLKDERYFDSFSRSLFIVAKSHKCDEVLDPIYTPGSEPEQSELFEAKQTFMFSVFNANLLTAMVKTIVRKHLNTTDAQAVWRELSNDMRTLSKGASEKRSLTQYITNTVLDDNFKRTTEQFVLHFKEQLGNWMKSLMTVSIFH